MEEYDSFEDPRSDFDSNQQRSAVRGALFVLHVDNIIPDTTFKLASGLGTNSIGGYLTVLSGNSNDPRAEPTLSQVRVLSHHRFSRC